MAKVELSIGAGRDSGGGRGLQFGEGDLGAIPNDLIDGDISDAQLRLFSFTGSGVTQIQTRRGSSGLSSAAGPSFTPAVESFDPAFVFKAGALRLELPGPNTPGITFRDADEPYSYNAGSSHGQQAFITAYLALSQSERNATTLTIADEALSDPLDAVFAGVGGTIFAAAPVNRRENIAGLFAGTGGSLFAGPINRRPWVEARFEGVAGTIFAAAPINRKNLLSVLFPGVGGTMFAAPLLGPHEIRGLFEGVGGELRARPTNRREQIAAVFVGQAGELFAAPLLGPQELRALFTGIGGELLAGPINRKDRLSAFFAGVGGSMLAEIDARSPPPPPAPPEPDETGRYAIVDAGGRIAVVQWEGAARFYQAPRRIVAIYRGSNQIWPAQD